MAGRLKLEVLKRSSASRLVAEQILEHIRRGTLKSGDQLPTEKELMQQLGVGRSSVREGLQILATLNLIESRPGAGTFLRIPKPSEHFRPELLGALLANTSALELLEARQMIEPVAVRLACIRATDDELDRVEALLDEHARFLASGDSVHEHAARFHVLLAECSHNQIAAQFMRSIMGLLMARGRKIERIPGYAEEEIVEHRAIAGLIRARDPDAASAAMTEHIVRSAQTYDVAMTDCTEPLAGNEFLDGKSLAGTSGQSI
jgi:GntR family transcriptional regulator, transcriptional repressor for pyruvate dehydrogenase complex